MAGVVALIAYVEAFNAGEFKLPDRTPFDDWTSSRIGWPNVTDGEDNDEMFGYRVLANMRAALQAMAVQS